MIDTIKYRIRVLFRSQQVMAAAVTLGLLATVFLTAKFGWMGLALLAIPIGYALTTLWGGFVDYRRKNRVLILPDAARTTLTQAIVDIDANLGELREGDQTTFVRELTLVKPELNDVLTGDADNTTQVFTAMSLSHRIGERLTRVRVFRAALFDAFQRRVEALRVLNGIDDEIATAKAGLKSLDQPAEEQTLAA